MVHTTCQSSPHGPLLNVPEAIALFWVARAVVVDVARSRVSSMICWDVPVVTWVKWPTSVQTLLPSFWRTAFWTHTSSVGVVPALLVPLNTICALLKRPSCMVQPLGNTGLPEPTCFGVSVPVAAVVPVWVDRTTRRGP